VCGILVVVVDVGGLCDVVVVGCSGLFVFGYEVGMWVEYLGCLFVDDE